MRKSKKMLAITLSLAMALSGSYQYGFKNLYVQAAETESTAEEASSVLTVTSDGNSWTSGYSMNVYLENVSADEVDSWKIVVDKADITISSIWCATLEETDDTYIITPASWNAGISAGSSVSFGFCGTGTMPDVMPGAVYYDIDGVEYENGEAAVTTTETVETTETVSETPATTIEPSLAPEESSVPSDVPSDRPSNRPSDRPSSSAQPSGVPSGVPSTAPSTSAATSSSPSTTASTTPTESTTIDNISSGSYTASFSGTSKTISGAYLIDGVDVTISGGTYATATSDQAVFLVVNGGSLTISDATIVKTGDATVYDSKMTSDVSDDYNFYGLNSAVVCVGEGSTASLNGTSITTNASGSNAVFATNSGSIDISDSTITTTEDSSRGLDSTYGGAITASNMTITTSGRHCATLANDRGGGTIDVTGTNTMNAAGEGSPVIYSTGSITVEGITGTSSKSQAIVIEGKNQVSVTDSNLTGKGSNGIMMYQSGSGDAADSDAATNCSTLTLKDSTINSTASGPMFYITNTTAKITCENTVLNSTNSTELINVAAGNWGTSGSNGGKLTFTAIGQELSGSITADSISSVALTLTESSAYAGSVSGSTISVSTDSTSSAEY